MRSKYPGFGPKAALGWSCLALLAWLWGTLPAHADIYGALSAYKKGDYSEAFKGFLTLAKLGQPLAQLDVARLYFLGRGVDQSYVYAYAWASLAAQNGEASARQITDTVEPLLPPGSKQVAEEVTAPYTAEALGRTLLPELLSPQAAEQQWKAMQQPPCWPVKLFDPGTPPVAMMDKNQGRVLIEYTVMPDGTARLPRVLYAYPPQVFDAASRKSMLRSRYTHASGDAPTRCVVWQQFTLQGPVNPGGQVLTRSGYTNADERLSGYIYIQNPAPVNHSYKELNWLDTRLKTDSDGGNDPRADLYYGLLIEGAPQLGQAPTVGLASMVKGAQAGLPLAQFQVGFRLLTGLECRPDPAKALKWLHMAAAQHQTTADLILAARLLHGPHDAAATARAKEWLEQAAAGGNEYGDFYLSALLAAAPDPQLRDPARALVLLKKVWAGVNDDPTAGEVQAAAQAAGGDFANAVQSEQGAIAKAHRLGWDLSPLEQRLALYQSRKPWYGELLAF